jgi:frataxin-like iron-binding protein CyaY
MAAELVSEIAELTVLLWCPIAGVARDYKSDRWISLTENRSFAKILDLKLRNAKSKSLRLAN